MNLFVPSTLSWSERKVTVQQQTDFPYADTTKLVINGAGQFDVKVRVPGWARHGFFVKVNGRDQALQTKPGSYVTLSRNWRANDTIEIRIPFDFYLDAVVDQPNVATPRVATRASISACASGANSPTVICSPGERIPTRRVAVAGWFVRIGRPR